MSVSAFSANKKFYGVTTVDFQNDTPSSVIGWSGLKAATAEISVEQKQSTIEFEDGSEVKTNEGWTGTLKLSIGQLDATDLTALEDGAPGLSGGIDRCVFTFTDRGNGSNYKVTITNIDSMKLGLSTGDYWKQDMEFGISAAADAVLTDFVTIAHEA